MFLNCSKAKKEIDDAKDKIDDVSKTINWWKKIYKSRLFSKKN